MSCCLSATPMSWARSCGARIRYSALQKSSVISAPAVVTVICEKTLLPSRGMTINRDGIMMRKVRPAFLAGMTLVLYGCGGSDGRNASPPVEERDYLPFTATDTDNYLNAEL